MTLLVLDSGGVSRLARHRADSAAMIAVFTSDGLWPPIVPSAVLVECLTGRQHTDVLVNRFLKTCDIVEELSIGVARRAGALRALARRGSAVEAIVVAMAEPGGAVLGGDVDDLRTIATYAADVSIHRA